MRHATWIKIGGWAGALGVILGAFGAHGFFPTPTQVSSMDDARRASVERRMETFETGARYHMYHALALVATGLFTPVSPRGERLRNAAGLAFVAGIALFSGPLYALGLGGPTWLGMVAPIGGAGFIAGWAFLASAAGVHKWAAPGDMTIG